MTVLDVTDRPVLALGPNDDRTVYPQAVASAAVAGTVQVSATVYATGVASVEAVGTVTSVAQTLPAGVDAASGAAGSPALSAAVAPNGTAGSAASGDPQVNADMAPSGLASTVAFGATTMFTSMNPSGIDATGGGLAQPSLTAVMHPSGIASAVQFGDADTLATVFVIPGPVDPSNEFGTVNVIRKGWLFRTPRNTYQWRLFKEYEGISLLKEDGVWSEVAHPDLERTRSAQIYLGGGRDHFLDDATKTELVALGYTVTEEIIL